MTLRHLNIFLCVCNEGSMTAAAEKLYISQPSVSQAIMELEKSYGVKLFERLGKKLYITNAGQKLQTYALHIIKLSEEAEREMAEMKEQGLIRIGASVTVGTCILSSMISNFKQINPNTRIESVVDNTKMIENQLLQDKLDFGIVEGVVHSQDLLIKPFMDDELVLICSPQHRWAKVTNILPANLEGEEFIVREEGSGTRELFASVMSSNGIKWYPIGVYNNAETIKNAVANGLGISVISRMAINKELANGELASIKIEGLFFKRKFSVIYHKNKFLTDMMKKFIASIEHYCAEKY